MSITIIGETNIDIMVQRHGADLQGGCTPADIRFYQGGGARNVAHNLCLLCHQVKLMTVFGGDPFAQQLINSCIQIGMDLSLSTTIESEKSPVFLSFNDPTGNMLSALSDITLNEQMNLDWVKAKINEINHSKTVVSDTLLSSEAIAYLIDHLDIPLFLDAVSTKRALRIADALELSKKKSFFALKCNLAEAQALSGLTDPFESVKSLNAKGIQEIYLTMGKEGVIYGAASLIQHFPALPAHVVNVTGSGDAFLAGIIHAHTQGCLGSDAVLFGLKAAQNNTESEAPVNPALRHSLLKSLFRS